MGKRERAHESIQNVGKTGIMLIFYPFLFTAVASSPPCSNSGRSPLSDGSPECPGLWKAKDQTSSSGWTLSPLASQGISSAAVLSCLNDGSEVSHKAQSSPCFL